MGKGSVKLASSRDIPLMEETCKLRAVGSGLRQHKFPAPFGSMGGVGHQLISVGSRSCVSGVRSIVDYAFMNRAFEIA